MLKSRSSDAFNSQLKDFIAPIPVNIRNCGQVIIRKVTDPAGSTTNFDYTKAFATDPASANTFQLNGAADERQNVRRRPVRERLRRGNPAASERVGVRQSRLLRIVRCHRDGQRAVGFVDD